MTLTKCCCCKMYAIGQSSVRYMYLYHLFVIRLLCFVCSAQPMITFFLSIKYDYFFPEYHLLLPTYSILYSKYNGAELSRLVAL